MGKRTPLTDAELNEFEEENRRVLGPQWREDAKALRCGGTTSRGYNYQEYLDAEILQADEIICAIVVDSHTPKGAAAGPVSPGVESSRVQRVYLDKTTVAEDDEQVFCIRKS